MKKLYISYNHENKPLAILLADDPIKAEIAFEAMAIGHYVTEEIDPENKDIGINGVIFVMTSRRLRMKSETGKPHDMVMLERGLK